MKRFKPPAAINIPEDPEGVFCLYSETEEVLQCALEFVVSHADDIENDINDFGELMPLLKMVRAYSPEH